MSDNAATILLFRLLDTSIRWGLLIAALAAWLAIRPPRRAATRHALCAAVLLAGPILAVSPRWGNAAIPWPSPPAEPAPTRTMPAAPELSQPHTLFESAAEPSVEVEPIATIVTLAPSPPSTPIDWAKILAQSVAGVWFAGMLVMLTRLALGCRALARWARRATPATADDAAMFDECRASLPSSRPVRLARHPEVSSPVVVGGLQPTILLPESWDRRSTNQRRAAIWHELAHVRRYDDVWKLVQELARAPSWHHPFVHWLLGRLDRERELLCDEAAVALCNDPKGLARLLLELSRRPVERLSPSASLPFLDRRTTAIRIERLLEDDMTRSLSRPSLWRTLTVGPIALAAALGLGGLNVRISSAGSPLLASDPAPAPSRPAPDELSGRIRDMQGRPIAGAIVVAKPPGAERQTTHTDSAGRFTFKGLAPDQSTQFLFWAPGRRPTTAQPVPSRLQRLPSWEIVLGESAPFSVALVDDQGRPLRDATVRLSHVVVSQVPGPLKTKPGSYAVLASDDPVPRTTATTGADGTASFPYASPEGVTKVKLEIVDANGRGMTAHRNPKGPERPTRNEMLGFLTVSHDAETRITVVPAARLEGRVTSHVAGVDLSALKVRVWQSGRPKGPIFRVSTEDWMDRVVPVTADGRFACDGLDEGRVDVRVEGPGRSLDWIPVDATDLQARRGATVEASLEIREGVKVEGRVVERTTGRPARNVAVFAYAPKPEFDPTLDLSLTVRTDSEGRYRLRVPAGDRVFAADAREDLRPPKGNMVRLAKIPAGAERFEVPTIEVPTYVVARIRVVDADHQPVAGARVSLHTTAGDDAGISLSGALSNIDGWVPLAPHVASSVAKIRTDEALTLEVVPPGGREQKFQIRPAADGLLEVVLPPEPRRAELRLRILDPDGKPAAGAMVLLPSVTEARKAIADGEGRVTFQNPRQYGPVTIIAWREGAAPISDVIPADEAAAGKEHQTSLPPPCRFAAVLVDAQERPIAGATVRATLGVRYFDMTRQDAPGSRERHTLYSQRWIAGSPLAAALVATTADDGSFELREAAADGDGLHLDVVDRDGRPLVIGHMAIGRPEGRPFSFLAGDVLLVKADKRYRLRAAPGVRLTGRITSQVGPLDVNRLKVWCRTIQPKGARPDPTHTPGMACSIDPDGRFAFSSLNATDVELSVEGPGRDVAWTQVRTLLKDLRRGETTEANIELIAGVQVEGRVVESLTGDGVPQASVARESRSRSVATDPDGRYRLRLPPGRTRLYVGRLPDGFAQLPTAAEQVIDVPQGGDRFEVPPMVVAKLTDDVSPRVVPRR